MTPNITQPKVESLRASIGKRSMGYSIYIPILFKNGDYILPGRNSSILKGCLEYKSKRYTPNGRDTLYHRLHKELCLPIRTAAILTTRSVSEIRRIELTIEGIIDSLLLFDSLMFYEKEGQNLLKHLIRKIFVSATYSTTTVINMWKRISLHVFQTCAESVTLEKMSLENNIFKKLLLWPKIQSFMARPGGLEKRELSELAHLISSRHLPSGSRRDEVRALEKLKATTTEPYTPLVDGLDKFEYIYDAARIIGSRCRKAGPGPLDSAHLSLAAAGSLIRSVAEGGRAKEIIEAITPILEFIPMEDALIETPIACLKDVAGIPRWRSWCRKEIVPQSYDIFNKYIPSEGIDELIKTERKMEFLKPSADTLCGHEVYLEGADSALGDQILACAYYTYQEESKMGLLQEGIFARTITIPEPGGKVRIVTTTPWWLQVLQQPIAHVTRAFLNAHPSAQAGLRRNDQAWQYLYLVKAARDFPLGSECLASDLSEATDAIPHEVIDQIMSGFREGLGYLSPLYNTCHELLITPRYVFSDLLDDSWRTTRGVFMGEPLAKTILTLLNLVCEEIAIRETLGITYAMPVQVPWRAFAVAGDDHIAIGPVAYLDTITSTHIALGSKISMHKHSRSAHYVVYCEKILEVQKLLTPNLWSPKTVNNSLEEYIASPFIDSIKLRLMSPCSKNMEKFNDRNTAIGKAKGLGNTLRWLRPEIFDLKWRSMVRDRALERYGTLMPDRSSGVYWHLLLPQNLGGLGLYFDDEVPVILSRLPPPSRVLIKQMAEGTIDEVKLALFKGFLTNASYRGYTLSETVISLTQLLMEDVLLSIPSMTLEEAQQKYGINNTASLSSQLAQLKKLRVMRKEDLTDLVKRPFLFRDIITGEARPNAFSASNLKRRYATLWDLTYDGDVYLTEEDFHLAEKFTPIGKLYDIPATKQYLEVNRKFGEYDLIEEVTIGLPELRIGWASVGMLV